MYHGGGGSVAKSCPTLVDPMLVAHQVLLSMGFSSKEYWSGFPSHNYPNFVHIKSQQQDSPGYKVLIMVTLLFNAN